MKGLLRRETICAWFTTTTTAGLYVLKNCIKMLPARTSTSNGSVCVYKVVDTILKSKKRFSVPRESVYKLSLLCCAVPLCTVLAGCCCALLLPYRSVVVVKVNLFLSPNIVDCSQTRLTAQCLSWLLHVFMMIRAQFFRVLSNKVG
jgi:hypothetical protein